MRLPLMMVTYTTVRRAATSKDMCKDANIRTVLIYLSYIIPVPRATSLNHNLLLTARWCCINLMRRVFRRRGKHLYLFEHIYNIITVIEWSHVHFALDFLPLSDRLLHSFLVAIHVKVALLLQSVDLSHELWNKVIFLFLDSLICLLLEYQLLVQIENSLLILPKIGFLLG